MTGVLLKQGRSLAPLLNRCPPEECPHIHFDVDSVFVSGAAEGVTQLVCCSGQLGRFLQPERHHDKALEVGLQESELLEERVLAVELGHF